jgi:hypothetical protein
MKKIVLLIIVLFSMYGCFHTTKPSKQVISVINYQFSPDDRKYNLNWPGPPRRPWTEQDKEYYTVTVDISPAAPEDFNFLLYIKENKFWTDPELGYVLVPFSANATRAQAKFWLVCTMLGKVKGNTGKGDDRHAKVYLEFNMFASEVNLGTWTWQVDEDRPEHVIWCDGPTIPPPPSCTTQADCRPLQWCVGGKCSQQGFGFGSCRSTEDCTSAVCVAARNVGTQIDILGRCEDNEPGLWDPDTLPPGAMCTCAPY